MEDFDNGKLNLSRNASEEDDKASVNLGRKKSAL